MPTYEYKCDACGATFERFQSITAAPIKRCPECGKAKVRRLIGTGAGVIFKGSGFYITDYRDKSYADKAKAESGGGGSSESGGGENKEKSGGDAKSETKAEAKSDAKPAADPKASEPKPAASKSAAKPTKSVSKSPKKK
jgi:putative FmdB family regulatory protein